MWVSKISSIRMPRERAWRWNAEWYIGEVELACEPELVQPVMVIAEKGQMDQLLIIADYIDEMVGAEDWVEVLRLIALNATPFQM